MSNAANGVRITELSNGIRVVTDRMASVESVSLGAWLNVGTRHEVAAENGVAHLLEHMVFKGTKRRTAPQIAEEIEAVGGHMNAYTAREQTAYYVKVLKQDVALGVDILSDILTQSTFDETELSRERHVILQEIGQAADTPDDIVFDYFQEVAYPDQAMGRPVLGRSEIVRDMSRDGVMSFINGNYAGDILVFSAAGNVEHDRVVEEVERGFGSLAPKSGAKTEAAAYKGGESRVEKDLEQLHLLLGFEGMGFHDEDFYAQQVLSMLFGGGMSSRLFQEVREKRGLVYSIYSFSAAYNDGGMFSIYAGTGEKDAAELVPVVCDELKDVAENVSEQEVERARTQLRSGLLMSRESTSNRCEQLAQHMLVYGRPVPVEELVAKVDAVDTAAIRRAAKRLLASTPTLAALGPTGQLESYDSIRARLN
ncbi:MAG: insulinase family protein [Nisaea sp.]|uniref:M16 family metallopeptidase n=1 Tax=Nisaea sp. TaxID=2024842 RepID=UPI001B0B9615|nr:pitrilysin family protein [Nisaea sp.]MBO6561630.1 insulinase family protein [Nisaea sp.]